MTTHRYAVQRPRRIPVTISKSGVREVDRSELGGFWKGAGTTLARGQGCYVFAMRHGDALRIFYVGMAVRTRFKWECFAPHKIRIYNQVLATEPRRRRPVLLFVTPIEPRARRPTRAKEIAQIEKWLINRAVVANPSLMNQRLIKNPPSWRISGVEPPGRGRPSQASRLLRSAL